MSKQALKIAELIRQLTLAEKLQLFELVFREIKDQALSHDVDKNINVPGNKEKDTDKKYTRKTGNSADAKRSKAAEILLNDYLHDRELTAFMDLDGDDIYEKK